MICRILSGLYLLLHRLIYERRRRSARRFPKYHIISTGNLSAGGTGKTPVTIALASAIIEKKKSVLICLRGYGGKLRHGVLVGDCSGIHASADEVGDEAVLIARLLVDRFSGSLSISDSLSEKESIPFAVVAGPNRADLIERFGEGHDVVLLDDAFQNPSVWRNFEIVLIDTMIHPDELRLLPCGRFREGLDALKRAHIVLLTRCNQSGELPEIWQSRITERYPLLKIKRMGISMARIHPARGGAAADLHLAEGSRIGAFCGIGNPESFFLLLEERGFILEKRRSFGDHHPFTGKDMEELRSWQLPLVTTEKDLARLDADAELLPGLFIVKPELVPIEAIATSQFWDTLFEESLQYRGMNV